MTTRLSPRVLLVGALLLATMGGVAATVEWEEAPVTVAATGGAPGDADDARSPARLRPGSAPTSSPTTVAVPASRPTSRSATTAPSRRAAGPTSTTPSADSTTSTTYDWRAANLPGPVGSTIYPWRETPYQRSDEGQRATVATSAPADGAVPVTTMPLTVTASWSQYDLAGAIVLIGPMDPRRTWEQHPRQVLASWSLDQCDIFATPQTRTVSVDLPMQKIVTPDWTMNNLEYEVQALYTPCEQNFELGPGAWVRLSFNVNEPWVVGPPGPSLGRTG